MTTPQYPNNSYTQHPSPHQSYMPTPDYDSRLTENMPHNTYTTANPTLEPPLYLPWPGASFMGSFKRFWKKYATFSGRASRSEFWWAYLAQSILSFAVIVFIALVMGIALATDVSGSHAETLGIFIFLVIILFSLSMTIPTLSITVRRLHDANHSGYWLLGFTLYFPIVILAAIAEEAESAALYGIGLILSLVFLSMYIVVFVFTLLPSNPAGMRFDKIPPTAQYPYLEQTTHNNTQPEQNHGQHNYLP